MAGQAGHDDKRNLNAGQAGHDDKINKSFGNQCRSGRP